MAHYRPLSIREKGLKKHFEELGLDYETFGRMVETPDVRTSTLRPFFRRPDGTTYDWSTVNSWKTIYLEDPSGKPRKPPMAGRGK